MSGTEWKSAIVGCGSIAQVHGEVLSELKGLGKARPVAFADIKPERAKAMAEKYGGQAYENLEELLDQEAIDVLHICTPHFLHLPMAQAAADRGIRVFTEKPPVISYAQWEEFQNLQDRTQVGICFQNRWNPATAFCRDLLAGGTPGALLGARAFVTWHRDAPYYTESGWRGSLATEGGGALINQAIHTLDLLGQFMGRGKVLGASLSNRHLPGVIEVEDTLEGAIQFPTGRGLFYATTGHCMDAPVFLELCCEKAVLRIEGEEVAVRWQDGTVQREDFSGQHQRLGKSYWGSRDRKSVV